MTAETTVISNDDVWIRSACELCLNGCGVLVHRLNGKVVKIEGDPENPRNDGFICGKGNSGMISQFSPYRIKKPLMRTNPEKGVGVDPKWQEVTWDKALDTVAARLKQIRSDDPRKLYFTSFMTWGREFFDAWTNAFGTNCKPFSSGFYCGNNVHPIHLITEAGFEADPDSHHVRYLLLVGSQFSSVVNYHVMAGANGIAQKRPGGIKIVSVDPIGSYAASKAEEWLPIRPGTDGAFLLSLANLLVNQYNLYDVGYLKRRTNAPYLVDESGHYVRDAVTNKPLIWDSHNQVARPFDFPVSDVAILGTFNVGTISCKPSFQVLKDHLTKYTPKSASEVTTIPESTIRRIAKEFGEAAKIGSTITIGGKVLPYRPACVAWYRGLSSHKHSFMSGLAASLLNVLIGAVDVPGGSLAAQQARAKCTKDGLMTTSLDETGGHALGAAYPPRKVISPKTIDLFELFPVAVYSRPFFVMGVIKPDVYKAPYNVEMLIQTRGNFVKTAVAPNIIEQVLKKIPFMVSITMELDETAEFADVVFPDVHYLERLCLPGPYPGTASGEHPYYWYGQTPVLDSPFETPWGKMINSGEIMLALAERAGFLGEFNEAINYFFVLKDPFKLSPDRKYTFKEIYDSILKSKFGNEKGLDWFLRKPLVVRERTPEEMYPSAFRNDRIHVYHEYMLNAGNEVEAYTQKTGLSFWDTSDYLPLPEWKPCPAYNQKSEEFDLYLSNYKVPQQPMSYGQSNIILQPLTDKHRDDDLLINTTTARSKGISDGDEIWIKTVQGKTARGRARVTELVHPEVIACQGAGGRFAKRGIKKVKGINFNDMMAFDEEHIDFVSTAVDSCVRIKVWKA